jgi:hypothetical protein
MCDLYHASVPHLHGFHALPKVQHAFGCRFCSANSLFTFLTAARMQFRELESTSSGLSRVVTVTSKLTAGAILTQVVHTIMPDVIEIILDS